MEDNIALATAKEEQGNGKSNNVSFRGIHLGISNIAERHTSTSIKMLDEMISDSCKSNRDSEGSKDGIAINCPMTSKPE